MGIKSHLEANFDYEIVDEFLDHYSLMVDSMEVMILDMAKPEMYHRSVDALFRVFHTIKSASGFLKLTPIHNLAKVVEDMLEDLRLRDETASEEVINWLLDINDMFEKWNDDLKNDTELSKVNFSLLILPDIG